MHLDFGDLINATDCNLVHHQLVQYLVVDILPGGMGRISTIQFITISSTGNTVKFGELTDRFPLMHLVHLLLVEYLVVE
jgi:hypothetical protein